jgi:hypothetical protein
MAKQFSLDEGTWDASDSPHSCFAIIFEDDGDTRYFCAQDRANESRVLDAVHIYSVLCVIDRDKQSVGEIIW